MIIKNKKITKKYFMLVTALIALMTVVTIASAITIRSPIQITGLNVFKSEKIQKMNLDVNHDGIIDQSDLDLVNECYGQSGGPGWIAQDVNRDGKVNILDVSLLTSALNNYEKPIPLRDITYVNVVPPTQFVHGGQTSSITVRLIPGESVIGVQIDLSFDPSLIQINSVVCPNIGIIWDFYFAPTIDNIGGEILGAGVVAFGVWATEPIDCFVITFTAQSTSGTSPLTLNDVIVTDQYANPITATLNSGSVMVDTVVPSVNAGVDQVKNALFTQDATVSDPAPSSGIATIAWTKFSGPGTITFGSPGAEDTTVTADAEGTYVLRLTVTDNAANSAFDDFTLIWDTGVPTITNIAVSLSNPIDTIIGWENFSCTVTDALSGVNQVFLYINSTPYPMQHAGSTYYHNFTLGSGHHNYHIYATDNAGNTQTSSTTVLNISPNWDVNMDGQCNLVDASLVSLKWLNVGTPGWIREDINNDGTVNILDVSAISLHWMQIW